ncbi:hypothetical protein CAEBREN_23514 [Caenorhabditis brenneri]|uniref:Uncharacterized protein n=1 Tax=Caenorhabditis brenneri TaxID=135651 RepID=G0MW25_CAEBE|nr:hypothetical protein CAEBREN_23514 [Caenorhabditis brenneri]
MELVNESSKPSNSDEFLAQIEVPADAAPNQACQVLVSDIPVGINRQPYHIPLPETCADILPKFKVHEDPNFPESVKIAKTILRKGQKKVSNVAEYPDDRLSNTIL